MIRVTCRFKDYSFDGEKYTTTFRGERYFVDTDTFVFNLTNSDDVLLALHGHININDFKSVLIEIL
jgi:hypothetical protein